MTPEQRQKNGKDGYELAISLLRRKLLEEGKWKLIGPRNEAEQKIAEGR